ncbi:chromate transporter, chromate ion transporter family [Synechococcus sp. PCC 7502]|uniref:chromate efflux transporter n=1 Tax=Synechococcus sp. PCC 7502 TaxID=1173263 RepID=UPI00029FBF68|nr:chromate efflux transporter [Synechococcus sp. PCC 7502]AFY73750.1 chromate transporter, chromate ion transporter family [Synechococcus sp. PCC 7502]
MSDYSQLDTTVKRERLKDLAISFLKLGTLAFGGPAAHMSMMDEEFVQRRQWLDRSQLLDMIGFTSLIPGPSSTELAVLIGLERGGWLGLIIAGTCFIFPALVIVWIFAVIYKQYQTLPQLGSLLYGIKPVIIAILVQALWKFRKAGVKNLETGIVLVATIMLFYVGVNEILLIVGSGLLLMAVKYWRSPLSLPAVFLPVSLSTSTNNLTSNLTATINTPEPATWVSIFLTFLKIGSVLYGGGYVLLAFLQKDIVERLHWLTFQQLLDAVAVGQVTPGPLFTTATFVGYLIGGNSGAIAATVGIFLPSFILVAVFSRFLVKLRKSNLMAGFLDGVNAAALGLIVPVTFQLGQSSLTNPLTIGIALISGVVLFKTKLNSTWLLLAGAAIGLISSFVG